MARLKRLVPPPAIDPPGMRRAARVRVIYGDTDKMGVVYHGTYLRYLEHGRVEHMRALGLRYVALEARGFGLPVIDIAVSYYAPARYDDLVSVRVAVAEVTWARLRFVYHLCVEPGDRAGLDARVDVLRAESVHCCTELASGRPTRLPEEVLDLLTDHDGDPSPPP
ncbi:MAG: thioesterase family protein [Nannocystaceae bacterium]